MLRLILPLAIFGALSCSKEQPPTAPAGKKNCALCAFLGDDRYTIPEGSGGHGHTEPDSSSSSSLDSSSPSDVVFIPDEALRKYIEKVLRKRPGETITQADMNTLQSLLAGNKLGIETLRGLETAKNLRNLAIGGNDISDLTPLVNLANLRYLYKRRQSFK